MNFFLSGTFWFIEGILFCLVIIGIKMWTKDKNIPMPYWKWILIILWLLFFEFTLAFITTSVGENETTAAVKGGILFGITAVISLVLVVRIVSHGFKGMLKR